MPKEKFIDILIEEDYKYIYIANNDKTLEKYFKDLFENELIENHTMYKIEKKDKTLKFIKIK